MADDLLGVVGAAGDGGAFVDASHQFVARHVDGYDAVDFAFQFREEELQGLRLLHGAGESVDDAAFGAVGFALALAVPGVDGGVGVGEGGAVLEGAGEECHDDVVAHEVAAVHDGLCALTQGCVGCHLLPQQVAGGDVQEVVLLGQELCLGAFAGAWGAEDNDVYHIIV